MSQPGDANGQLAKLREGDVGELSAGGWHDWWNATDRDARVIVEVTPGARFAHMLETMFGLAQMGYVDAKGMPNMLQLAMTGREFSDAVQFKSPPPALQKVVFALLAPLAHAMGYRGTYPELSRSLLPPDPAHVEDVRAKGLLTGDPATNALARPHRRKELG